jgi:hypothetical protein
MDHRAKPRSRFWPLPFALLAALLHSTHAIGSETQVRPDPSQGITGTDAPVVVRWIDVKGNLYKGVQVVSSKWVWSKQGPTDPFESPALRLELESLLSPDLKPVKVTSDGVVITRHLSAGSPRTLSVDLRAARGTLRFDFVDRSGKRIELSLIAQLSVLQPFVVIRPECAKYDLRFNVHIANARHLYVGLTCVDRSDRFAIYFFRSRDSVWRRGKGLVDFDPNNKYLSFKQEVKKPKDQVVYSQQLFRTGTADETGRASEYSVVYTPRIQPKRFFLSAGLGVTHYSYQETLPNLDLTQISLTGKVNLGVRLIPKALDLAFNFFGNIVSLKNSPTEFSDGTKIPPARFYGLNGRIGYRLPFDMGANELFFLTGWYFWGMRVPGLDETSTYGIKSLNGPQLFFMFVNSQADKAGFWIYSKFALIADQFSLLGLSNRELAVGGGVELSARAKKPFAITLDIAHAQFSNVDNGMKLLSFTLGVQKSI